MQPHNDIVERSGSEQPAAHHARYAEVRSPRPENTFGFSTRFGTRPARKQTGDCGDGTKSPEGPVHPHYSVPSSSTIAELALKQKLPAVSYSRNFAESGGLMAYGVNLDDQLRRAATYVDKILKGARPGDIPVEQATKFELVINLKTAKAIGLTIPPSLLARADRVIE